jgi:hypothetical protein
MQMIGGRPATVMQQLIQGTVLRTADCEAICTPRRRGLSDGHNRRNLSPRAADGAGDQPDEVDLPLTPVFWKM